MFKEGRVACSFPHEHVFLPPCAHALPYQLGTFVNVCPNGHLLSPLMRGGLLKSSVSLGRTALRTMSRTSSHSNIASFN